jgi:hypothetical protein
MPTCPKCGKEYQLGLQDAALRRSIGLAAKYVQVMHDTYENAKSYCNECFRAEFKTVGQAILGTLDQVEGSEKPKDDKI